MSIGGEIAEEVVKLSLEGFEIAVKVTGAAASHTAKMLAGTLKQTGKTRGKTRLSGMLKKNRSLCVYTIPSTELRTFTRHAKEYGILYCVLRDRNLGGKDVPVDILAGINDGPKIERIIERYGVVPEKEKTEEVKVEVEDKFAKLADEILAGERDVEEGKADRITKEAVGMKKEENPSVAVKGKEVLSRPGSEKDFEKIGKKETLPSRPSVKMKLKLYRNIRKREVAAEKENVLDKVRDLSVRR